MPRYLKNEVVLVRYPFSDLSGSKVRPAVVVSEPHVSQDVMIVPLTSQVSSLLPGEFVLAEWSKAGLNVQSALKRGLFTVRRNLIAKAIGRLSDIDADTLEKSLREWLGLH